MAKALQTYSAGLIIRQKEPTNLETPLDQVDSYLTPTELFTSAVISRHRSSTWPRTNCALMAPSGTRFL